jgi:uncharacterized protein (DUF2147 family)
MRTLGQDCARIALAALLLAGTFGGPAFADPTGIWLDKDGWTIRVYACGQALCAAIASTQPPLDPTTGKPWTDRNNPDASKRDRPLVGVQVLFDMHPNGPGKWSGTLYDSDRGNTYSGNLLELGADRIRIEGCMIMLCGGEELRRVSR